MISKTNFITGKHLLEIITRGMYSNSLMVLREYIQNSVDSVDKAISSGKLQNLNEACIDIDINGKNRSITISDNGIGIDNENAIFLLCSLGVSTKNSLVNRGFRGIGRLGGLGYCDKVIFETRSVVNEKICSILWDGIELRNAYDSQSFLRSVEDAVKRSITVDYREANENDPPHFFRVILMNVHRFHKDQLMNLGTIKVYLEQVLPLPFQTENFIFAKQIENHLKAVDGFKSYLIRLNGTQLFRPHSVTFQVNANQIDSILDVELFNLVNPEKKEIGRGWYAKTNFLGSIPLKVAMRGIRIRQGNIEVGNEYYLENTFSERRFASWHIGEIHLNYSMRVNARRDDFEQSKEYETFLEQAQLLCQHLSYLCRKSSKLRCDEINAERILNQAEELLSNSIIINTIHRDKIGARINEMIIRLENKNGNIENLRNRIKRIRNLLSEFYRKGNYLSYALDGRILRHMDQKVLLEKIANEILSNEGKSTPVHILMKKILLPYLKRNCITKFKDEF